jgi:hypothetical protein
MKAFAARMKYAEMIEPIAVAQIVARCTPRGSLSQPKIQRPMNVASKKKASSPSRASGAPKTSPTNREYSDQFMPNWNSCTIPVTTPMAKLMRKIEPKNRVIRRYSALPVRYQAVWNTAAVVARPIVSGTKRKW